MYFARGSGNGLSWEGKGEVLSLVAEEIQIQLQAELRQRLPDALYEQWFSGIEIVACDKDALELGVKNRFFKSWIETRYLPMVCEAAEAVLGRSMRVTVVVSAKLYAPFREAQEKALAEAPVYVPPEFKAPAPLDNEPEDNRFAGMGLNPDFTFDTFVVGASNRLSHAVSLRAVECPGEYSRLYFCGEHGVGKTHLLQALCHQVKLLRPDARVAYVTCERFVSDFGAAHASGALNEFRRFYRRCDVLAIDQLQVLGQGNKAATQAELVAILDDMGARGKQVVFAATLAPNELDGVDARLRDRFGAGFVDRMSLPDESVRRRLIERKLTTRGIRLPEEAIGLLARDAGGNVMRLEGAVNRLAALIDVGGMQPNLSCLRLALDVSTPAGKKSVLNLKDIIDATAEEFGVTPDVLCGRGRTAPARRARTVAVVLCRKLLGTSYAEIGVTFGGRSHATVISMMKKAPAELFSVGLGSRPVERVLFRLGVGVKPEELLERQSVLF